MMRFCIGCLLILVWNNPAYSDSAISSHFVANSGSEVDMLNLVEAPAGHLTGTLTVSAINDQGTRDKDVVRNVTGSIYQNGVSLQVSTDFLDPPQNVVGKLQGNLLSLAFGNSTIVFRSMTDQAYQNSLALLDQSAANQKILVTGRKAASDMDAELKDLTNELQGFVEWGNVRIVRVAEVQKWYSVHATGYRKCLDQIQPLAEKHVPSWQWQNCVIALDNDKYNRDQMSRSIRDNKAKEKDEETHLNDMIVQLPNQIAKKFALMRAMCPLIKDKENCYRRLDIASQQKFNMQFQLTKPFIDYTQILPKLHEAIDTDTKISIDGEQKLTNIVNDVDVLYKSAQ